MEIIPPPGYVSLSDARDILMRRMHTAVSPSEDIQVLRKDGLHVVDAAQATAAAQPPSYSEGRITTVRTFLFARYADEASRSGAYRSCTVPFH